MSVINAKKKKKEKAVTNLNGNRLNRKNTGKKHGRQKFNKPSC